MKLNKVTKRSVVAIAAAFLVLPMAGQAYAAKGDHGVDWSRYQGSTGKFGYASDKFAISQVGGYYNGSFVPQSTYATQVQYAIAQGKRAHTYIYDEANSLANTKAMLDYYLPKIQTPKGSIVALDVESGNPNTQAVRYGLQRIQDSGYTAVLYCGPQLLKNRIDLKGIAKDFPLWASEYPDYQVRSVPDYNYFPSFDNIQIFQFTSTYVAGGLDGNIDLLGITDNGYTKNNNPKTKTPAVKAGIKADNTPKSDIKKGDTVKVNYGASRYATGQVIPSFVKGVAHKVVQVNGNKVLLADIMSWVNKSDVEILSVGKPVTTSTNTPVTGTFKDSGWTIHRENGTFTANTTLRIWNYPGLGSRGTNYYRGESVKYDGWVKNGKYTYVSYRDGRGLHSYIAVRENGVPLGTFK
ncbi:GH25 family lysozyme [Paucilactobacillus sp. N302-9]